MKPMLPAAAFATLIALGNLPAVAQQAAVPSSKGAAAAAVPASASVTAAAVAKQYGRLVHAAYTDTQAAAESLQKAVQRFIEKPSEEGLNAARKAWLEAREFYGQTEAFRFYGGPIDDKNGPEGRINAWPMDESYVDYVKDAPNAGIINKKTPITKKALIDLNERDGEENIATGWHAIEFLLWGQDFKADGPGDRSYEDFVDGKKPNADRRRQYLKVVTDLLVEDLASLTKAWEPRAGSYRSKFERGGIESVRKMFVGLGSLSRGELAGERLEVALASQAQEDEHSCFSDNTHRDVVNNAKGILNVWLGEYKRADGTVVSGASLRDLVALKNAALAERTTQQIQQSLASAEAIQAPFDREIVGGNDAPGRLRVQKTIDSLIKQSKDLVEAANAAGITRLTLSKP